jgi:hypothetical protein
METLRIDKCFKNKREGKNKTRTESKNIFQLNFDRNVLWNVSNIGKSVLTCQEERTPVCGV